LDADQELGFLEEEEVEEEQQPLCQEKRREDRWSNRWLAWYLEHVELLLHDGYDNIALASWTKLDDLNLGPRSQHQQELALFLGVVKQKLTRPLSLHLVLHGVFVVAAAGS
jgi:hypothetical protein